MSTAVIHNALRRLSTARSGSMAGMASMPSSEAHVQAANILQKAFFRLHMRKVLSFGTAKANVDDLVAALERRRVLGTGFFTLVLYMVFFFIVFFVIISECGIEAQYKMSASILPVLSSITFGGDGSVDSWQDVLSWDDLWEWTSSLATVMTNPTRYDGTSKSADEVMRSTFGHANKIIFGATVRQERVQFDTCVNQQSQKDRQSPFPGFDGNECVVTGENDTLFDAPAKTEFVENRTSFQGKHVFYQSENSARENWDLHFKYDTDDPKCARVLLEACRPFMVSLGRNATEECDFHCGDMQHAKTFKEVADFACLSFLPQNHCPPQAKTQLARYTMSYDSDTRFDWFIPVDGLPVEKLSGAAHMFIGKYKENYFWDEKYTKRVSVMIPLYNSELHCVAFIVLNFEREPSGKMDAMLTVNAFPATFGNRPSTDALMWTAFIMLIVAFLVSIASKIRKCKNCEWNTVLTPTDALDLLLCVAFFYYYTNLEILRSLSFSQLNDSFDFTSPDKIVNSTRVVTSLFSTAAEAVVSKQVVDGASFMILVLLLIRMFTFLHFEPNLALLTRTITESLKELQAFTFVFGVSFLVFGAAGQILFGARVEKYSTLMASLESNWHFLFTAGDREQYDESPLNDYGAEGGASDMLVALFFLLFTCIMILLLLNVFLAIVLGVFVSEKEKTTKAPTMCVQFTRLIADNASCFFTGPFNFFTGRDDSLSWHSLLHKLKVIQEDVRHRKIHGKLASKSSGDSEPTMFFIVRDDGIAQVSIMHIGQSYCLESASALRQLELLFEYDLSCEMNEIFKVPERFAWDASVEHLRPNISAHDHLKDLRREHHDMKAILFDQTAVLANIQKQLMSINTGGNGGSGACKVPLKT